MGISFTDDLDAVLPGLTATGLPQTDVCGAGSQIDGTSTITLTGGILGPGEICVFMVTLNIPGGATSGNHTNLTSVLGAMVGGSTVVGDSGSEAFAILQINQQPAIPALDPRGMMALAVLMALIGCWLLRARQ